MLQLKKVGDVVQMVFFWFLFRRQDDKGPVVVLEGGWKLRCESLASLGFVLYGLVEKVGDIVQVVK